MRLPESSPSILVVCYSVDPFRCPGTMRGLVFSELSFKCFGIGQYLSDSSSIVQCCLRHYLEHIVNMLSGIQCATRAGSCWGQLMIKCSTE